MARASRGGVSDGSLVELFPLSGKFLDVRPESHWAAESLADLFPVSGKFSTSGPKPRRWGGEFEAPVD